MGHTDILKTLVVLVKISCRPPTCRRVWADGDRENHGTTRTFFLASFASSNQKQEYRGETELGSNLHRPAMLCGQTCVVSTHTFKDEEKIGLGPIGTTPLME